MANNRNIQKTMRYYILLLALFGLCLTSCRTQKEVQYFTIERVKKQIDTVRIYNTDTIRDSVVITYTDSIRYADRWHTKIVTRVQYETKMQTDTLYQEHNNTIVKEVAKPLKWWQRALMTIGLVTLIALFMAIWFLRKQ